MTPDTVAGRTEDLRQIVIHARDTDVDPAKVERCLGELNDLHRRQPDAFTAEDVRWLNKLVGVLSVRRAARTGPAGTHAPRAKRKGDTLAHCWRCETPVDDRFGTICPDCSSKAYKWMRCPVCAACGCQRTATALV